MADTALRAGSLCSGFGGLEMGAELAFGPLRHMWHGEYDPAPSAVLTHRWPGTPNLGDIAAVTAADGWADLPPVDALFAGYPCQPFSNAGLRKGLDDPRNRWPDVAAAVCALRPSLVFLENVRGHLSRGFGSVVASLAAIGYVGRWRCVRASDAGAAHRRERLFVIAWPAEDDAPWLRAAADPAGLDGDLTLLPTPVSSLGRGSGFPSPATAAARRDSPDRTFGLDDAVALLPTPSARDGKGVSARGPHPDGYARDAVDGMLVNAVALLPTPTASRVGYNQGGAAGRVGPIRPSLDLVDQLLPTPTAADSRNSRNATAERSTDAAFHDGWTLSDVAYADRWGAYGPAIARWEQIIGRPAPDPTVPGKNRRQLSPLFVEWLMGLPAGHVTDVVTKRGDALRVLGNGVVPQAAALALQQLLAEPVQPAHVQLDLLAVAS